MITQERLKELLYYDPTTGIFTNLIRRGHQLAGTRAGTLAVLGYRQIQIGGVIYKEHHLAWLYVYGVWPDEIDHKDGDRQRNVFDNLREATRTQNCYNSNRATGMSGLRGAILDRRDLKWYSRIKVDGQAISLGKFATPEEAHKVYLEAAERYHGEFALHKRNLAQEAI